MSTVPLLTNLVIALGLSLFFGLAFEEFRSRDAEAKVQAGGVRTFPLLALTGAMLYLLDPTHLLPLSAGLVVLGALLFAHHRRSLSSAGERGAPNVGLVAPTANLLAFLLGPIALTQPRWVTVGVTVAAVLLLTARERLHAVARRIEISEIITAGKFLILTGIILPLLPNQPFIALSTITPYQAWLALLAVCTLSYASYLLQRYVWPGGSELAVALLGGLYSSTATTVVLARHAAAEKARLGPSEVGIVLATAMMYLRILAIVAVFDIRLAGSLALPLIGLSAVGLALAAAVHRWVGRFAPASAGIAPPANPLEIPAAALFAATFIVISIASAWAKANFGLGGVNALAALVGVTDIDPFVLSLAQGSVAALPVKDAAVAVLIATASNNLLKAAYTLMFYKSRGALPAIAMLLLLAAATLAVALA